MSRILDSAQDEYGSKAPVASQEIRKVRCGLCPASSLGHQTAFVCPWYCFVLSAAASSFSHCQGETQFGYVHSVLIVLLLESKHLMRHLRTRISLSEKLGVCGPRFSNQASVVIKAVKLGHSFLAWHQKVSIMCCGLYEVSTATKAPSVERLKIV